MNEHRKPHFDEDGCCDCQCGRCAKQDITWNECTCADCNKTECGMHYAKSYGDVHIGDWLKDAAGNLREVAEIDHANGWTRMRFVTDPRTDFHFPTDMLLTT